VDWVIARVSRVSGERRLLACKSRQPAETGKLVPRSNRVRKDVAGNYRLEACAPQRERCVQARLTRDCAHLFRNRFAFFALVNYESVIIAMSGPRATRHFLEIYKLPVGHIRFL
jgi:hypothetical protein